MYVKTYACFNLSDLFEKLLSVESSHTYKTKIRLTIWIYKIMLYNLC